MERMPLLESLQGGLGIALKEALHGEDVLLSKNAMAGEAISITSSRFLIIRAGTSAFSKTGQRVWSYPFKTIRNIKIFRNNREAHLVLISKGAVPSYFNDIGAESSIVNMPVNGVQFISISDNDLDTLKSLIEQQTGIIPEDCGIYSQSTLQYLGGGLGRALEEALADDETTLFCWLYLNGQALVCTDRRVLIVLAGRAVNTPQKRKVISIEFDSIIRVDFTNDKRNAFVIDYEKDGSKDSQLFGLFLYPQVFDSFKTVVLEQMRCHVPTTEAIEISNASVSVSSSLIEESSSVITEIPSIPSNNSTFLVDNVKYELKENNLSIDEFQVSFANTQYHVDIEYSDILSSNLVSHAGVNYFELRLANNSNYLSGNDIRTLQPYYRQKVSPGAMGSAKALISAISSRISSTGNGLLPKPQLNIWNDYITGPLRDLYEKTISRNQVIKNIVAMYDDGVPNSALVLTQEELIQLYFDDDDMSVSETHKYKDIVTVKTEEDSNVILVRSFVRPGKSRQNTSQKYNPLLSSSLYYVRDGLTKDVLAEEIISLSIEGNGKRSRTEEEIILLKQSRRYDLVDTDGFIGIEEEEFSEKSAVFCACNEIRDDELILAMVLDTGSCMIVTDKNVVISQEPSETDFFLNGNPITDIYPVKLIDRVGCDYNKDFTFFKLQGKGTSRCEGVLHSDAVAYPFFIGFMRMNKTQKESIRRIDLIGSAIILAKNPSLLRDNGGTTNKKEVDNPLLDYIWPLSMPFSYAFRSIIESSEDILLSVSCSATDFSKNDSLCPTAVMITSKRFVLIQFPSEPEKDDIPRTYSFSFTEIFNEIKYKTFKDGITVVQIVFSRNADVAAEINFAFEKPNRREAEQMIALLNHNIASFKTEYSDLVKGSEFKPIIDTIRKDLLDALQRTMHNDEKILIAINGSQGEALVATDKRVLIFKFGFSSGALLGQKTKSFFYEQISSVEVSSSIMQGRLQITVPGSSEQSHGYRQSGPIAASFDASQAENVVNFPSVYRWKFDAAMKLIEQKCHESKKQIVQKEPRQENVSTPVKTTISADELRKYHDLLKEGIISQEEFDSIKKRLLNLP